MPIVRIAQTALRRLVHPITWSYRHFRLVNRVITVLILQTIPNHKGTHRRSFDILGVPMDGAVLANSKRCILLEEGRIDRQTQTEYGVTARYRLQTIKIHAAGETVLSVPIERFLLVGDRYNSVTQIRRLLMKY